MSIPDWSTIDDMFERGLAIPAADRDAWLHTVCGERPDLHDELRSLFEAHDRSPGVLEPPPDGIRAPIANPVGEGTVLGAYRLARLIGHGGMGDVYLGTRVDGTFTHEVAVKVTQTVVDAALARRFASERQILASLRHPHIVTLIDGGTAPGGQAYLVMEYVDGVPVTTWLTERRASIEQRLRTFRTVCGAVSFAHQHAIVHRDLKPANILVTGDGVPKVLDFGIAKLLDAPADGSRTILQAGPLTPDYASPEQLRGLAVTTASDVYSLGVLLFEILAGRRPYETTGRPLDVLLADVLDGPTRRVSAAADAAALPYPPGRLRGDIDAIVRKAMHVEPAARYASAEELSDDIARFLGGKPVNAREPSAGYLLRKLAARHRAVATVAALALVAIVGALGIALYQKRQADTRFDDIRQITNTMIFDVHDALVPIAGSMEVRRLVVERALQFLDRLAATNRDERLQFDIARGYNRIGRAQGDPQVPNLGDREGALRSFRQAMALLEPLRASRGLWREAALEITGTHRLVSDTLKQMGRGDESLASARDALASAEALYARAPADDQVRRMLASAAFSMALAYQPRPEARAYWDRAQEIFQRLLDEKPDDLDRMRNVALVHKYVGALLQTGGDERGALARYEQALALDEKRAAAAGGSATVRFDLAIDLGNIASSLARLGRRDEAVGYHERSVALREAMFAADPKDARARSTLATAHRATAQLFVVLGDEVRARQHAQRVIDLLGGLVPASTDARTRLTLAIALRIRASTTPARIDACRDLTRAAALTTDLPRGAILPDDEPFVARLRQASEACG